jgi:hypothetical protein
MSEFKSSDRIRRAKHEKNYTIILNSTIQDSRLSWKARGLHHYILSLPDDWHICVAHLAEQSEPDGEAIIKSALKELEVNGYITKTRLKDERGRFLKCVWDIYESPQVDFPQVDKPQVDKPQVDKPQVDKPQVDKPQVDKPQVENHALISTNKQSTYLPSTEQTSTEEENTRSENIYTAPPENFPESDLPAQETLISDLADQNEETPPPTPAPLAVCDSKLKTRRSVLQEDQETFAPFLAIWNRSAPKHWDRYDGLNVSMIDDLKKFVKVHKKESLQIFEEGLLELSADNFIGTTKCDKWRFGSYFTKNKPKKYSDEYKSKHQRRSQQSPLDRPMTPVENKMALTYSMILEAIA